MIYAPPWALCLVHHRVAWQDAHHCECRSMLRLILATRVALCSCYVVMNSWGWRISQSTLRRPPSTSSTSPSSTSPSSTSPSSPHDPSRTPSTSISSFLSPSSPPSSLSSSLAWATPSLRSPAHQRWVACHVKPHSLAWCHHPVDSSCSRMLHCVDISGPTHG